MSVDKNLQTITPKSCTAERICTYPPHDVYRFTPHGIINNYVMALHAIAPLKIQEADVIVDRNVFNIELLQSAVPYGSLAQAGRIRKNYRLAL
jgi:hypothetical protein